LWDTHEDAYRYNQEKEKILMKKQVMLVAGVLLVSMLVGCANVKVQNTSEAKEPAAVEQTKGEVDRVEMNFKQLENVFGFADEAGEKLITISTENGSKLINPEEFNIALGNNGEMIRIKFVKQQEANDMDVLRQTMYNFNNMAGYIYEAIDGKFIQNKTYLLSKDTIVNRNALVDLESKKDMQSKIIKYQEVDIETIKQIEVIKGRKIIKSSLISESSDHEKICLFVFERKADDMLASIAYTKEEKVVFKDYPAKYNETSTWRVDGGDDPGLFEVLFLANSDEGLLLGLTWAAPEGENVYILKEVNGIFEETALNAYRYSSPN